jgi:hypothetical protein
MKKLQLFSWALVATMAIYACKDKTVDPPANNNNNTKTRQQLLTGTNWKISALTSGSTDIWGNSILVPACNRDNEYKFRTTDSMVAFEKSNKCNTNDPDSTVSFYKLYNNNTQLILNMKLAGNMLNDTAEIIELTESTLKVDAQYSSFPATITFIHP